MRKRLAWRVAGLLLVLTVLGMIGYHLFVVRPREEAFAQLQRRVRTWGGDVFLEQPFNRNLARLRPWIGNDLTLRLGGNVGTALRARVIDATKEQLRDLLNAPRIHRVNLDGSRNLDDDWVAGIDPTSSMFQLSIGGTGISDRSVPKILEMQGLASLDLTDTAISDTAVDRLRELPQLRELCAGGPNIKAVRLVGVGVFDGSGRPAVQAGSKLRARGRVKVSGLPRSLSVVRVMVRAPGDPPSWRSRPYGWNASVNVEGKLVKDSAESWSFDVVLPALPAGKLSIEVWVQEPNGARKVILYRLEPFTIELAPIAEAPAPADGPSPVR
jgi:hypothetical protein